MLYADAEAVKALPVTASVRKAGFSFEEQQRQNTIIWKLSQILSKHQKLLIHLLLLGALHLFL